MFNSTNGYSLSDIAAATGSLNNGGNDTWGDGGAWWIIILFLFVFCGWGGNGWNNGFGGGGSGAQGALTRSDLCSEFNFQGVDRAVQGLGQGLADGFYAQNTGMLNGFANVQSTLCQGFNGVNTSIMQGTNTLQQDINSVNVAAMQNSNALQNTINNGVNNITAQLTGMAANDAACCCAIQRQIEGSFADLNYNLATQSCATQRAIADSTRDITDNNNANTRAILDFLTQDKIATLTAENQNLKLAASQQAQNNYLVNALRPAPVPAFPVPAPYQFTSCGNSCGC